MSLPVRTQSAGSRHKRIATATCGHCGVVKTIELGVMHGSERDQSVAEQKFAVNKLEREGWLIGKKDRNHRCPGCYSAIKVAQPRKNEENIVSLPVKPSAEVPREMSREERRIIFEKLNEVYVDEKTGYGPGWTDAKAATDLGVPRAWVKQVRDEMFGPEGANEEIRATVAEAQALLDQIKTLAEPLRPLLSKADTLEKRLIEIAKALQ